MQRQWLPVALAVALIAGCATSAPQPDPDALTELIALRYSGQPVQSMMSRYGAPAAVMRVPPDTIYTWYRSQAVFLYGQQLQAHCQMDAYVHADGKVWRVGLSGQNAACPLFE
ncbi:MAG TPA: hypothetical protein VMV87_05110 [Burkholderiales bacterium]|nr:hypothetical protein [Burkholderiales bacterium]